MDIFEAEMARRFVVAVEKIANALDPQTNCNGCIYENDKSLMACVSCQGKVPYDGYDFEDEPKRGCDADCHEDCTECAKEWQDWKDQMWAEAIVTEPTISKMEQVDEPQTERSER